MAYAAGNVAVTTGQAAQQMLDLIEAQLTAAGWVFVEQYPATGPGWRVWRCPAALNGVQDFYVLFYQGSSALIFGQCEGYDPSTHQMKRGFYTAGSSGVPAGNWDATTQTPYGQTAVTLTSSIGVSWMMSQSWNTLPTATFDYIIRAGAKHLCFTFTWSGAASPIGKWVGLFDTLLSVPANDPVPLAQFDLWSSSVPASSAGQGSAGSTSRTPLPATDTIWTYVNGAYGGISTVTTPALGVLYTLSNNLISQSFNALGGSNDGWGAPAHIAPKFLIQAVRNQNDGRSLALRGKIPGMVGFGSGSGVYLGDEFTFDGKTYAVVAYNTVMGLAIDKAFTA